MAITDAIQISFYRFFAGSKISYMDNMGIQEKEEKVNSACADLIKARTILTGIFFITICKLFWFGQVIPPLLERIVGGLLLMWFGEKAIKYIKNKENGGDK